MTSPAAMQAKSDDRDHTKKNPEVEHKLFRHTKTLDLKK